MMYMSKKALEVTLEMVRKKLCGYTKPPCDCKYQSPSPNSEATGCPEIYEALAIVKFMKPEEYAKVQRRIQKFVRDRDKKR